MPTVMFAALFLAFSLCSSATAATDNDWYNPDVQAGNAQCRADKSCSCQARGHWKLFDSYFQLKNIRDKMTSLEEWMQDMDLTQITHRSDYLSQKLDRFERDLSRVNVDQALGTYAEMQLELESLMELVTEALNNGTKEEEIVDIERQVTVVSQTLVGMWKSNPYAEQDRLNVEISVLNDRLANCQEVTNGSYFRGDELPLKAINDHWCDIYEPAKIGDSLTHATSSAAMGNWFKDPYPVQEANITGIWMRAYTVYNAYHKFHYANNYAEFIEEMFAKNLPKAYDNTRTYGLGYIIYNGSLYYHYVNQIYKYTISNGALHRVGLTPSATEYLRHTTITRVDIKVDEYGLYAIYTDASNNEKLIITKIDPLTLQRVRTWNTNRHKSTVCATFMICGTMYTLDNCWSRMDPAADHKQYMYDTLTGEDLYGNWHLTAKFGHVWMAGYNPRERVIFAWDNGKLVTYPVIWKRKNATTAAAATPQ